MNRKDSVCGHKESVKNHIRSIRFPLSLIRMRTGALGRAQVSPKFLLRRRDSITSSGRNRICLSATRRTVKRRSRRTAPFFICEQLLQPDRSRYGTYWSKKERGERLLKDALPFSPISTGHSPRPMYYFNPMQTSNPVPRISLPITGEAVAICAVRAAPAIAPFRYFGISLKAGREGAEPTGRKINNGQKPE